MVGGGFVLFCCDATSHYRVLHHRKCAALPRNGMLGTWMHIPCTLPCGCGDALRWAFLFAPTSVAITRFGESCGENVNWQKWTTSHQFSNKKFSNIFSARSLLIDGSECATIHHICGFFFFLPYFVRFAIGNSYTQDLFLFSFPVCFSLPLPLSFSLARIFTILHVCARVACVQNQLQLSREALICTSISAQP